MKAALPWKPVHIPTFLVTVFISVALLWPSHHEAANGSVAVSLHKTGQRLLHQGKFVEALDTFKEMGQACAGDRYCTGVATFYLARTHLELAQYDQALDLLQSAEDAFANLGKDNERAKVYHVRGRVYSEQSQFAEALHWYGLAEGILSAGKSRDEQELFQLWMNRAKVYVYLSKYDDAEEDLNRAENSRGPKLNPSQKAMIAQRRGWILAEQQRFPEAEQYYTTALKLFDGTGNNKQKASVLNNLAHIDETRADFPRALEKYREALKLSKEFASPAEQAFMLNNIGNVQRKRGDYDDAVRLYQEALKIRKQLAIKQFYAETFNNLGIVYLAYGNYGKAFDCFRECYEVSKKTGSPSGQAWALHNMAWVYKDQGLLMKSQQCSSEAIALAETINNRRLLATAVLRLGNLTEYYGNFEEAISQYVKASTIQAEIGDRFFLSNTYFDLGTALTRKGKIEEAEKKFEQSIELKKLIGAPKGESLCKFALFFVEKIRYVHGDREVSGNRTQDLARAHDLLEEADNVIKPDEKNDRMLLTYVWGRLLLEQNPEKAAARFAELRSLADTVGSLKYSFLASTGLGLAYEKMGDWARAESNFEMAVDDAEKIRDTLDPYLKKTFLHGEEILGVKHVLPYQGLARVRMRKGDKEGSLKAAEFTKARSFSDKLAQKMGGASFGVDRRLTEELNRTETDIRANYKRLEECRRPGGDGLLIGKLEEERSRLRRKQEKVREQIKRQYPDFYSVRFPQPITLDESALKNDEFVLAYEVTDKGVLIYLTRGKEIVTALFKPVAKREVEELVHAYRSPLERVESAEHLLNFDFKAGDKLFDLLIGDMLDSLPPAKPVVIVPDGTLAILPFEMLPLTKGGRIDDHQGNPIPAGVTFFAERNSLSYWQSITALTLARNRTKGSTSSDKMLVVANPVPGRSSKTSSSADGIDEGRRRDIDRLLEGESPSQIPGESRTVKLLSPSTFTRLSEAFGSLQETQPLADEWKKRLGEGKIDVFSGRDATMKVFRQRVVPRIGSYSNILFATHGYFGNEMLPEVDEPILVFSMIPQRVDNLLRMSQVMELDINAGIVTLLACQSGMGEEISGEGTMGMGRAFQYAGAKSVLMSLWKVDVHASVKLADVFLTRLSEGKGKLEALQMARKEVRQAGFDHPFFWASFILVGEID